MVRTVRTRLPVDLRLTLGPLRRGGGDPCTVLGHRSVWRASRTPDGPTTTHVCAHGDAVLVEAWGPGSGWALEHAPALLGADDDLRGFTPRHPVVADLHRRLAGLRICRSGAVVEALVPSVLEQKVTGVEARRSWRMLVRAYGEPAPGPAGREGMLLPPAPATLAALPFYALHRFGVERRRADTVRRACGRAARLEETVAMSAPDADRRLTAIVGVGPWTSAEVRLVALGDADAVSVGDYHLPNQVAWALAGEPRGDDERMLELLEPYRGHRGRVLRLLAAGGVGAPRRGPRQRLRAIASI